MNYFFKAFNLFFIIMGSAFIIVGIFTPIPISYVLSASLLVIGHIIQLFSDEDDIGNAIGLYFIIIAMILAILV